MAFATDGTIGARFDKTDVAKRFALGTRVAGSEGTEWIYVQADGAVTGVGYAAVIDEAFQAVMLSTSNDAEGDLVGIAAVAFVDNDFGWLQVKGPTLIRVAASCGANASLNATATAGQLDDDGTATSLRIEGAVLTTAREASAGTAAGMLNDPIIVGTTVNQVTANITTVNSTTVNAVNIDAGASGTAGTVDVFPTTASKGKVAITAADSAGDTTTTIVNASQAGARTYTIPDAGASAAFMMTAGAQTVAGVKTFTDSIKVKQAVNNVHDTTPTAAELTTSFGDPATLGRGFVGTVDDADGDTNGYIVWVSDASFYFVKGTKAT